MVLRLAPRRLLLRAPVEAATRYELPRGHIPALDAIRGLAIVLVCLYRFFGGEYGPARAVETAGVISLGSRGVDLFFVLSGFLITGILLDTKGKAHYFRNFYVRRALRIFPLYYATLLVLLVVLPALWPTWASNFRPVISHQAWLWFYGANVLQAVTGEWPLGPMNHFWSLAVEEHFYLAWPLVIYFTSRRTALWTCGGLVITSCAARAAWLAAGGNDAAAEVFTLFRLDGLALGGWMAVVARSPGGLDRLRHLAGQALVVAVPIVLVAWVLGKRWLGVPTTAWAVVFASLLVLTLTARRRTWFDRLGNSRALQFFGKYSYAMYVFQLPLIYALAHVLTASDVAAAVHSAWLGQAIYGAILLAATTLMALASWHLFEKRWLAWKQRFGG